MFLRENEIGERLAPRLEPGMTLLDVGAGTGRLSRWLLEKARVRPTLTDVTDFGNREEGLPFVPMIDPVKIPAPGKSFDVVMLLFVLHHIGSWLDQERLLAEAARVARTKVLLIEDTPASRVERAFNTAWDWLLNIRHGVPTPFTFRPVEGWGRAFRRAGLVIADQETYRPRWPTLGTYPHTLFDLRPARGGG